MKIKSFSRLILIVFVIVAIIVILPDLKPADKTFTGVTYDKITGFFSDNLGFDQSFFGAISIFVYSLVVALLVWVYYHIILLLRMITVKDYKLIRKPEIEGVETKLLSLSRYRLMNMFFGRLYKCVAFAFFMLVIYNIPILNRIIYLYTLGFINAGFWSGAVTMSVLFVIGPKMVNSFLFERRKAKLEKGLIRVDKLNALVAEGNEAAANV